MLIAWVIITSRKNSNLSTFIWISFPFFLIFNLNFCLIYIIIVASTCTCSWPLPPKQYYPSLLLKVVDLEHLTWNECGFTSSILYLYLFLFLCVLYTYSYSFLLLCVLYVHIHYNFYCISKMKARARTIPEFKLCCTLYSSGKRRLFQAKMSIRHDLLLLSSSLTFQFYRCNSFSL